jgi:hypothetical protein
MGGNMQKLILVLLCIGIVGCSSSTDPDNVQPLAIEPDPYEWVPVFHFDGCAAEYCYPDTPDPEHDGRCITTFDSLAPVYYEGQWCSSKYYKLAYWVWYGRQQDCFPGTGSHNNDWEHVILNFDYTSADEFVLESVTFYQHQGWYTRGIEATAPQPDVYVGKIGHGSYHNWCDGVGLIWEADYCQGGCGYWDDFRNDINGIQWKPTNLIPLDEAKKIEGSIGDRVKNEDYADLEACEGSFDRVLTTAGCWQNNYGLWPSSRPTNDYDEEVFYECSGARLFASNENSKAITGIYSVHNNDREDRIWTWECTDLPGGPSTCEWSGELNAMDMPIEYTASDDYFISGVASYHNNGREDRIWWVKICKQEGKCCTGCQWTDYLNNWDEELSLQTGGKVICGISSYHNNDHEDRRWKFLLCDLVDCQ